MTTLFDRAITCEYASLTASGDPVTVPVTPYVGETGTTLDVSTGLTYPAKAERARRNPKVALLFADPLGSGLEDPPTVLVQGLAAVRDADLQANTDRYVRVSLAKLPAVTKGQPRLVLRRMAFYYASALGGDHAAALAVVDRPWPDDATVGVVEPEPGPGPSLRPRPAGAPPAAVARGAALVASRSRRTPLGSPRPTSRWSTPTATR